MAAVVVAVRVPAVEVRAEAVPVLAAARAPEPAVVGLVRAAALVAEPVADPVAVAAGGNSGRRRLAKRMRGTSCALAFI
jgi:hypothetical protein